MGMEASYGKKTTQWSLAYPSAKVATCTLLASPPVIAEAVTWRRDLVWGLVADAAIPPVGGFALATFSVLLEINKMYIADSKTYKQQTDGQQKWAW